MFHSPVGGRGGKLEICVRTVGGRRGEREGNYGYLPIYRGGGVCVWSRRISEDEKADVDLGMRGY